MTPKPAPANAKNEALAMALARGATAAAAARQAGMSARSVHRRLQSPLFVERVEQLRQDLVGRTVARLSAYSSAAARRLHQLTKSTSGQVALGAARALLELSARYRSDADHAKRFADLERDVKAIKQAKQDDGDGPRIHRGAV